MPQFDDTEMNAAMDRLNNHPILSKLDPISRLALIAELTAEFNAVFIYGVTMGFLETSRVLVHFAGDPDPTVTEDMKRALMAAAVRMLETSKKISDEYKKGENSAFSFDGPDNG